LRGRDLDEWTGRLETREKELADRESAISEEADLSDTARERVDKREKRLVQTEANLRERVREIDDREEELERREARYDTDYEIRLEKLETREQALASLEEKLGSKESQLAAYVAQAQGALQRRESEWWNKQLGRDDDADAEVA
jgi:chromosome segregation ATPase